MRGQRGERLPRLVEVMQRLLAPGGCPWDRAQTLQSLRPYVVEEAFEVVDAIDRNSWELLREELGDLLLQIIFAAELARASGRFGPDDVIDAICDKLIRRHPHVFGDGEAEDAAAAVAGWERIKRAEKAGRGALDGVPVGMPGLLRAVRVGEKAAAVGYDWPDAAGPRCKIDEELGEMDAAFEAGDRDAAEREMGDLLFSIASFARKRAMDPEAAIRGALDRFSERFGQAERLARASGRALDEMQPDELDALWQRVKRTPGPGS